MSEKHPIVSSETSDVQQNITHNPISRRQFIKTIAVGSAAVALTSCDLNINRKEYRTHERLIGGFDSVFHLMPTTGVPSRLIEFQEVESQIYSDDVTLLENLKDRFKYLPENTKGRDIVIQSLGYPHIIHNNAFLYSQGYDVYNNFAPEGSKRRSDYRSLEVMKHNIRLIEQNKDTLTSNGVSSLRGIVLNYDAHASDYAQSAEIDKTFPDIEFLKNAGFNRLIFIGEFSPSVEILVANKISDDTYSPDSRLIDFIQLCQKSGIEIVVLGIDTRHDIDDYSEIVTGERQTTVSYVTLENGVTVIYGGEAPDSNPRVKLEDGTLLRIIGGEVEVITTDDILGRAATQEEENLYYKMVEMGNLEK